MRSQDWKPNTQYNVYNTPKFSGNKIEYSDENTKI